MLSSRTVDATKAQKRLGTAHQSHTSLRTCNLSEFQSIRQKFTALERFATPSSLTSSSQGLADVMYLILSACFVRDAHFSHNGGSHMHVSERTWGRAIWMFGAESLKSELSHSMFDISFSWRSATRRCSCLRWRMPPTRTPAPASHPGETSEIDPPTHSRR